MAPIKSRYLRRSLTSRERVAALFLGRGLGPRRGRFLRHFFDFRVRFGLLGLRGMDDAADRRAGRSHEVDQEAEIMQAEQPQAEDFPLVDQVPYVRAAEPCARRTAAVRVEWARIAGEPGVPQVEAPLPRQGAAGAGGAGRQD